MKISNDELKINIDEIVANHMRYRSIAFEVFKSVNEENILKLQIKFRRKFGVISIRSNNDVGINYEAVLKRLPIQEGDFFSNKKEIKNRIFLKKYLSDIVGGSVEIDKKIRRAGNAINVTYYIKRLRVLKVDKIIFNIDYLDDVGFVFNQLNKFTGKTFDRIRLNVLIDKLARKLLSKGYLYSSINMKNPLYSSKNEVILHVDLKLGKKFNFYFNGNKIFSRKVLLEKVRNNLKGSDLYITVKQIKRTVIALYEDRGIYNTKVNVDASESKIMDEFFFFVKIKEGRKVLLHKIRFSGNKQYSKEMIIKLYNMNMSTLAGRGFLDKKYLEKFKDILTRDYLEKGYLFINVSGPIISFDKETGQPLVSYVINEGQRCVVSEINFNNIDKELSLKILKRMKNRGGSPFNALSFQKDLDEVLFIIKEEGYFYAQIVNMNQKTLLTYFTNHTKVKILIDIKLGKKIIYDKTIVIGNEKLNGVVVRREVSFIRGDVITPERIETLRRTLSQLALFSSVSVSPFITKKIAEGKFYANILIHVKELEFGIVEFAPGYRTDIGLKVSSFISYRNLNGKNRVLTLKGQVNQRLDFSSFDERRSHEEKRMLEYIVETSYREPYLFHKKIELDLALSQYRKRYYGFDASVYKISQLLSKDITTFFNLALKYQYEDIKQYDATEVKDSGSFNIGSLTTMFTLDFRDNKLSPRKGSFFSLSLEYGGPALGSQDDEDLEIDYITWVLRNNFYIPLGRDTVFAFSISGGRQKNRGNSYIPSIKVFRLDGIDIIRGFTEDETNRVESGEHIGKITINETAHFLSGKFEFRYYLDDNTVFAPFLDLGKIYLDGAVPDSIRSSIGTSFKIFTPVGSLDFDYGIKLKRERYDGKREQFGQFHLSIGFF